MWIDGPRRAPRPDLLVDVAAPRDVEGAPDADARAVEGTGPGLGHVTAAVDLLVVDRVLVVVVGLEGELGAADRALEAARMEEGEVLERPDPVYLVHRLLAAQARALVEVRPIHLQAALFPADSKHELLKKFLWSMPLYKDE